LLGQDAGGVGVDDEAGVFAERVGIEVFDFVGVGEVDAPLFQHRLELLEAGGGLVVAVVAEEEDLEGESFVVGRGCAGANGGDHNAGN
jgi:hypothetical protein